MAAKVFSIICYVVAGFFVYMVAILAFATVPSVAMKAGIMFGFSIPAFLALWAGFALSGFRRKLRDAGIVLLSAAGFTAFLVFSFVCFLATDEFKKMMKPDSMAFFSDYKSGFGLLLLTFAIGLFAFRKGSKKSLPSGEAPPSITVQPNPDWERTS